MPRAYLVVLVGAAMSVVLLWSFPCAVAEEPSPPAAGPMAASGDALWDLARRHAPSIRFSTLFTAEDVRHHLGGPEAVNRAMRWCKDTGVTHVYLESFRGGYTAPKALLLNAKKAFADAGFLVSGCVTTVGIGRKPSDGWLFPCFSEPAGQAKLAEVFGYAAELFDEVMIDDFFATQCECPDCVKGRGDKPWAEYRCDLLMDVSQRFVLEPARKANPKVKLILKYPQWYEQFHKRGYEVVRQTRLYDKIWVGTETREPDSKEWGRKSQYEAYFIMRWLGAIGGPKCGGGWFDPYGTKPATYVEQARQTILGGAGEAVLFCYGSLQNETGPANVKALRQEMPRLFRLAELVRGLTPRGIAAPKPPNSDAEGDEYVYDYLGLLGLPLVPSGEIRVDVPCAFLPRQALKDKELPEKLSRMIKARTPLLLTQTLAKLLPDSVKVGGDSIELLEVPKDPWQLMGLPAERLKAIRKLMLAPLGVEFDAPSRVALYLFGDRIAVIENFDDREVEVSVKMAADRAGPQRDPRALLVVPADAAPMTTGGGSTRVTLAPRSLIVLDF
ncbi:MAG: hypothetical protein KA354_15350 [Phycisphaerae bacterium]|nr:hypothetical protein [Phycisphaerae bacterium]